MDVVFDAKAANELLQQMNTYCTSIVRDSRELLDISLRTGNWNDVQKKAFANGINEIAKDLDKTLAHESEYMNTFNQRIIELRG